MKENKRNELLAGVVILLGIFLLAGVLILAGNFKQVFQKKRIIRVHFNSARGLEKNNPVQVSGVDVGVIKDISFIVEDSKKTNEKKPKILVLAEVPQDIYIAKDSSAEISVSLTGITVLKISRGNSKEELGPSDIIQGDDAVNLADLTTKFGKITSSIEEFVGGLNSEGVMDDFKAILVNARTTTEKLVQIVEVLDEIVGENRKKWTSLISNADNISKEIDQLIQSNKKNISVTFEKLPEASKNMKELTFDMRQLVKKNDENLTLMIADLQQTSKNLKDTSRSVKRQPWVLLRKPEKGDAKSRDYYTAARDMESTAVDMRNSLVTLRALSELSGDQKDSMNQKEMDRLLVEIDRSLKDLNALAKRMESEIRR